MKKVSQLKAEILSQVYPSGAPENLLVPVIQGQKSPLDMLFDEAFSDISKFISREQQNNVDLVEFCKTNFKCGMTVLDQPRGIIRRLFTVGDSDYCDPVFFKEVDWPLPESQALRFRGAITTTAMTTFPMGFFPADASTDAACGRSRNGIFAKHRNNLYLWPWIQSTELIAIEWDGIKERWSDDDPINSAVDYKKAVKLYIQYGKERDYGTASKAQEYKTLYDEAFADLAWQAQQETKRRESFVYPSPLVNTFQQGLTALAQQKRTFKGSFNIPVGASGAQVTGLGLSFTPGWVDCSVLVPVNGLLMEAHPIVGTLSSDGFSFYLTGVTDTGDYVLNYEIS